MLVAGGTGGHLIPAMLLGEAFKRRGHEVVMVGSKRPLDLDFAQKSVLPWQQLSVGRLKGLGLAKKFLGLALLPWALFRAICLLIKTKPDLIFGIGGAHTGPLLLTARFLGLKTTLLEQNRIPGFTNRLLAPIVHRIFIGLPLQNDRWQRRAKLRLTGQPTRQSYATTARTPKAAEQPFSLFVFGGSQGARFFNELMSQLLPHFADEATRWQITHITGTDDYEAVRACYQKFSTVQATVLPFTEEMDRYYQAADLVVGRSGAGTLTDIMATACPAFLIPYPYAADGHQDANARYLEAAGAAIVKPQSELNPELFWQCLSKLRSDPKRLAAMGARAHELFMPHADERILDACEELVGHHV